MERLNIPFSTRAPGVEEAHLETESASDMVLRLAEAKARQVADSETGALVIGSDQTLVCDGRVLGKPLNVDKARAQLQAMRGKKLVFHTGLAVVNTDSGKAQTCIVDCTVAFRDLDDSEIDRYLQIEQPFNCAGSFKSEALGIALLESLQGDDPTALIGLPLIRLSQMLRNEGLAIP